MAVGLLAAGDGEEFFLNALGDRAARACSDLHAINRANWRDFRGGAGEENFICNVKHLARNSLFAHGNIQVAANGQD